MKRLLFVFALVVSGAMYQTINAQVSVNVNIGSQPVWGPAGYDYAEYYYFPDMDVYYHVPDRQFIFFDGRNWVFSYSLPAFYNRYDLYNCYKVVINEPRPYLRADIYRSRYHSYRGRPQENIYNSRDSRYFVIKGHPEHERWIAGRNNNNYPGKYIDNRAGNYDRMDDYRLNDRRFENQRSDNNQRSNDRRFDDQRSGNILGSNERRFENQRPDNNQRSNDKRFDNQRRDNNQGANDWGSNSRERVYNPNSQINNRRSNENDRRFTENNRNGNNDNRSQGRRF